MDQQQLDNLTRQQLDQRAEGLDGATLSRLRQARAHAMEHGLKRRRAWLYGWLPVTALATAAATLLAVNLWYVQPQAPELELLENLALEEIRQPVEELEFYDWLAGGNGGPA